MVSIKSGNVTNSDCSTHSPNECHSRGASSGMASRFLLRTKDKEEAKTAQSAATNSNCHFEKFCI